MPDMNEKDPRSVPTAQELDRCIEILKRLAEDPALSASVDFNQFLALTEAAGRFSRPNKNTIRIRNNEVHAAFRKNKQQEDRKARATTGIRKARTAEVFQAPAKLVLAEGDSESAEKRVLSSPRNCYVCTEEFTELHFFYDLMCAKCAEINYRKRFQTASLHGQVAVLTGARLKIGYQVGLMLLRAGARLIATTRFPADAALRYSREADFSEWRSRLEIYGLDLRHTPSVELFARHLSKRLDRLDILINNAAEQHPTTDILNISETHDKKVCFLFHNKNISHVFAVLHH